MIWQIIIAGGIIGAGYLAKKKEESSQSGPSVSIRKNTSIYKPEFTPDSQSVKDTTVMLGSLPTGPSIFNPPSGGGGGTGTVGSTGGTSGGGSAGSGGGIGGGGGLSCPIEGTEILALDGAFNYHFEDESSWISVTTENDLQLTASASHLLYSRRGLVRIENLTKDDFLVTKLGESQVQRIEVSTKLARKLVIEVPSGHLYWANGILSHNLKKVGY